MDERREAAAHGLGHAGEPRPAWRQELSVPVRRLAEIALGHALVAVRTEAMVPFVILDRAGGRVLGRFEGDPRAALARARAHVRASDAARAALGWAGYLTIGGVRQEAVVVEVSDRGRAGVVVAHRYRETTEGPVVVGRPVLVGPGDPLL